MNMRSVAMAALLPTAMAWITISQNFRGAMSEAIRRQLHGEDPVAVSDLSYIWTMPEDTTSSRGLGRGISWAWDRQLCDELLPQFNENFFFGSFVTCFDLRAAMHRGFASWAAHHSSIHFVDVTEDCERMNMPVSNCSLVEVWVHVLEAENNGPSNELEAARLADEAISDPVADLQAHGAYLRDLVAGFEEGDSGDEPPSPAEVSEALSATGTAAAFAYTWVRYTTSFRFTDGTRPYALWKFVDGPSQLRPRKTIESYGGVISFNKNFCWCTSLPAATLLHTGRLRS